MKKLLSLLLTLLIATSLFAIPASAADDGKITINNTVAGDKIDAYKIFDLSLSADGKNYSYTMTTAFKGFFSALTPSITTDEAAYKYVQDKAGTGTDPFHESEDIIAFARDIAKYVADNSITATKSATAAGTTTEISDLPLGYYVVVPTVTSDSKAFVNLTTTDKEATVNIKKDAPEIDKYIVEDSTDVKTGDYSLGDTINFKLTSNVPDMTYYNHYYFIVHDTMSKGITYNGDSIKITVDGDELTKDSDYTVETSTGSSDETIIKIVFNDFYSKYKDSKDADIIITYTGTLNGDSIIGNNGNPNEVYLQYSNDPKFDYDGTKDPDAPNEPPETPVNPGDPKPPTDDTPKDVVKVFTFKLDITKTDDKETPDTPTPLPGAEFSLWSTTPTTTDSTGEDKTIGEDTVKLYRVTAAASNLVTDSDGKVTHNRLKDGTYYLFEEVAPVGFNKITDPIKFTISHTVEEDETNGWVIKTLTVDDNAKFSTDKDAGQVATTVVNKSGEKLPETGGIGTIIFTLAGIAIMGGSALAMFFMKKRKKNEVND